MSLIFMPMFITEKGNYMSKRRRYIIIGAIVALFVVLCISVTMCHGEPTDNQIDKDDEKQTEIIHESEDDEDEVKGADDSENVQNADQTEMTDKNTDTQNQTLIGSNQPSEDNSVDYEDVWGDGQETSGSGNSSDLPSNDNAEDSNNIENDEEPLDDTAKDDKNSGYSPLF